MLSAAFAAIFIYSAIWIGYGLIIGLIVENWLTVLVLLILGPIAAHFILPVIFPMMNISTVTGDFGKLSMMVAPAISLLGYMFGRLLTGWR